MDRNGPLVKALTVDHTDRELIDAFRKAANLKTPGQISRESGIPLSTAKRLKGPGYPKGALKGEVREAVAGYTRAISGQTVARETAGVTQQQVDAGLPELARLLDKALSLDGEVRFRAWAVAEVNAAYRSYALAKEADNSGARARAVESEGRAAEARLSAISPAQAEAAIEADRRVTEAVEKQGRRRPRAAGE